MKIQVLCLITLKIPREESLNWAPHRGRKKLFQVGKASHRGIAMTTNRGASEKKMKNNFKPFGIQDNFQRTEAPASAITSGFPLMKVPKSLAFVTPETKRAGCE